MSEPDRFEASASEAFRTAYDSIRKPEAVAFMPYAPALLLAGWLICLGLLSIAAALRSSGRREGAA